MNTSSHHSNDDATISVLMGEGFAKPSTQASPRALRWLALGTIVGPVLFALAWLVLGQLHLATRPSVNISDGFPCPLWFLLIALLK